MRSVVLINVREVCMHCLQIRLGGSADIVRKAERVEVRLLFCKKVLQRIARLVSFRSNTGINKKLIRIKLENKKQKHQVFKVALPLNFI